MAEHIVSRALRAQVAAIDDELASDECGGSSRVFLQRIRTQFRELASQLNAIERQPVAEHFEHHEPDQHSPVAHAFSTGTRPVFDTDGPSGVVPECTHDDNCRVAMHPRGPHWVYPEKALHIDRPAGVSGLAGGSTVTYVGGTGGAAGAGAGGGGSSFLPSITISADRLEKAAKAAYARTMDRHMVMPVSWGNLHESTRQVWREAVTDALRAALERDHG